MEPLTAGRAWGNMLRQVGKGFRTPSFKLTERNAKAHPESRRNDKQTGISKAARSYKARYA